MSIPLSRQVRLAGALLLLSLPLAVGVWMAGSDAAERDRKSSDQRLGAGLDTAAVAYQARFADARYALGSLLVAEVCRGRSSVTIAPS